MDNEQVNTEQQEEETERILYPEAPDNPLDIVRAKGFAGLATSGDNSLEARKARSILTSFVKIAGKHVQGPVALEAAERIVAAITLRRRLEEKLIELGAPATGASKIDNSQRAAYNATINAWRQSMTAFNDALKMLRNPEKKRAMVPLADLVQALGAKMPVVEVEYETVD